MSKIIFTRGIQGSGKSTWAKEWVGENPMQRWRINFDELRLMLGGTQRGYWVPRREQLGVLDDMLKALLTKAIAMDIDVVVDNMNLNKKSVKCIQEFCSEVFARFLDENPHAKNSDLEFRFMDFKTPLEECIARDAQRECPIGEQVIRNTYNRYKDFYNN